MHQIRFKVTIKYKDFDNNYYVVNYNLFANSNDDAEYIARELFFVDYGSYSDMVFDVTPVVASSTEQTLVNTKLIQTFGVVNNKFTSLSYRDFLKAFINFDGNNLVLKQDYASFWFKFMDLECKAVWKNRDSYVSEDEVIVHIDGNRTFLVKNRLCDIYKAY